MDRPTSMQTFSTSHSARQFVHAARFAGRTIGIVPTMGALHAGHLSLVRAARQQCDDIVATIFVNPSQFAPGEDFDKYPRTVDRDLELLQAEGIAATFVPTRESMYPEGFSTYVDPPEVAKPLEGVCRPGHFRGVATIVLKLFQILPATHAFFGQKDYQQLKVIEAMTRDLDVGIEIVACETVRERDGLALSSRNRYLSAAERNRSLSLSRSLERVAELARDGEQEIERLQAAMRQQLIGGETPGVDKIDYAVVVDATTLAPLTRLDRPAVALIAAFVGQTRLIDNRLLMIG